MSRTAVGRVTMRRLAVAVGLCVSLTALAACGKSTDSGGGGGGGDAANPPTIPVILPLTGASAQLGTSIRDSLQKLTDEINKQGLVKTGKLQLKFLDNQSTAATAVSLAAPLISSSPFIMNGALTSTQQPVNALATKSGPVIYNISPGVDAPGGSYLFVSSATTLEVSKVAMKWASAQKFSKVALISSTDASGTLGGNSITSAAKTQGDTQIVTSQKFGITDASVSSQVAAIAASKPDVIVVWTTGPQVGTVFQALRQNGLGDTPVVMSYGNIYFSVMNSLSSVLPSKLYSTAPQYMMTNQKLPDAQQKQIDLIYQSLGIPEGHLDSSPSYSADGLLLFVEAVNKLGNGASATQIRDYIQTLTNWPGIDGVYNFSADDHRGIDGASYGIVQYQASTKLFTPISPLGG
jgi:branched-chain amino acid transport system substrate-binding protein